MHLTPRVRQFLAIVDVEIGLDVFFEASCNYNHVGHRTEEEVVDKLNDLARRAQISRGVDSCINYTRASDGMGLDRNLFRDLNTTVIRRMHGS